MPLGWEESISLPYRALDAYVGRLRHPNATTLRLCSTKAERIPPAAWLQRLDADVAPRHGAARIRLDADGARRTAAVHVGVVEAGSLRALTAL